MPTPPRRRSRLVTALAVLLALESVTVVAVRAAELRGARAQAAEVATAMPVVTAPATAPTTALTAARSGFAGAAVPSVRLGSAAAGSVHAAVIVRPVEIDPGPSVRAAESAPRARPAPAVVAAKATKVTTTRGQAASPSSGARTYRGRNHVWSPALGIDKPIYAFPCNRSEYPGNVVYRWGCAGRNNVYLFGHAANVFGGLNRAYYDGRLKRGLKVHYADRNGTVRTYAVRWWKVVYPTPDQDWAWASLARPSMTLQTCVGKNSEKRLMVRLTQVSG